MLCDKAWSLYFQPHVLLGLECWFFRVDINDTSCSLNLVAQPLVAQPARPNCPPKVWVSKQVVPCCLAENRMLQKRPEVDKYVKKVLAETPANVEEVIIEKERLSAGHVIITQGSFSSG